MADTYGKRVTDLRSMVFACAQDYGDKPRYIYKHKRVTHTFSFNDLKNDVTALGEALYEAGLCGKTVALVGDTHPAYLTAYISVIGGGGIIVPLDRELQDSQIADFIRFSKAEAVIYTSEAFNKRFSEMSASLPDIKMFISVYPDFEKSEDERFVSYTDFIEKGRAAEKDGACGYMNINPDPDKCCAILFTSGTMGISKGVMLSQNNIVSSVNASCETMDFIKPDTRILSVLPVHHTYEMTTGQLAATNLGLTSYINESLKYFMKNISEFKPELLLLVPLFAETMDKRIWESIASKGLTQKVKTVVKLSNMLRLVGIDKRREFFKDILAVFGGNLTHIVCGGAALDDKIIKDFDSIGITVLNGYGITECAPLVSVNTVHKRKIGTIGTPVPECSAKVEKENGQNVGEILVKGKNVMLGYYENPEATAEAFTPDGWFRTGDVGYIDRGGYVHITGRKKNIIILSNGKNIYPEEIESYIMQIPLACECVVVGRKGGNGEVCITALIYPDPDLTKDMTREDIHSSLKESVNEVNRKLPIFKQVRAVEVRYEPFEKTSTRKIKRYKVK